MSAELVTINTEWLSDCSGCHIAIVDLHEKILSVLESVKIQRCPVLTDVKDYPPAKIGLVSQELRPDHCLGLMRCIWRSGRRRKRAYPRRDR